jgi:hypothetical protein
VKPIRKVWSHISLKTYEKNFSTEIRKSEPRGVRDFRILVRKMAYISYNNPEWTLFFRGQHEDKKNKSGLTSLYPSIYRSRGGLLLRKKRVIERFEKLKEAEEKISQAFKDKNLSGYEKLKHFREIRWAILQHYKVCDTPLLDLTHSLRVACSFALNNSEDHGFLFVLGLPHPHGSISYSVEEELFNIKLLSICPPKAIRPYYQEGYLVGSFPVIESLREPKLDMARRLVAKFKLIGKFWDENFHAIPDNALTPESDPMKRICDEVQSSLR